MTCLGALKSDYEHFKKEILERLEKLEHASDKGLNILLEAKGNEIVGSEIRENYTEK